MSGICGLESNLLASVYAGRKVWSGNKFVEQISTGGDLVQNAGEACRNCADRQIGCHTSCERYQSCKKKYLDEKEQIRKKRMEESAIVGFSRGTWKRT